MKVIRLDGQFKGSQGYTFKVGIVVHICKPTNGDEAGRSEIQVSFSYIMNKDNLGCMGLCL